MENEAAGRLASSSLNVQCSRINGSATGTINIIQRERQRTVRNVGSSEKSLINVKKYKYTRVRTKANFWRGGGENEKFICQLKPKPTILPAFVLEKLNTSRTS